MSQQCCDECGGERVKIHRRYLGIGYCGSCYARVFKSAICPECAGVARLPRNIPRAICQKCIVNRPCARCGIAGKPVGLINNYGTVCASCSPYFRNKEPCEVCGKPSHRLTRVTRFFDGLKRCEQCATSDHSTCSGCGRYRKLQEHEGEMLCKLCSDGKVTLCSVCGKNIPLARGLRCESCYWEQLFSKRVQINGELIESAAYQAAFKAFSKWLLVSVGANKAAITISKYPIFFREIEKRWPTFPSHANLLMAFGADYLRRFRKVVSWIHTECGMDLDEQAKKRIAEEQRIGRILDRVPRFSPAHGLVIRFSEQQWSRYLRGDISLLTVRLSLTPAVGFLAVYQFRQPTTKSLAKYLKDAPGQRASITRFIGFLNSECDYNIRFPRASHTEKMRRVALEKKLVSIMAHGRYEIDFLSWCILALEFFHKLRLTKTSLKFGCVICFETGGCLIEYGQENYFVPMQSNRDGPQ